MSEIRVAVLSDTPLSDVLDLVCGHAADLLAAASSGLTMLDSGGLDVLAASGAARHVVGRRLDRDRSLAGKVVRAADAVVVESLSSDPGLDMSPIAPVPMGLALGAPVICDGEVRGALTVARPPGAALFTADDCTFLVALAHQASLALELDNARADRERLLLAADRERIARDLHDLVIQRLFASGMSLQGLVNMTSDTRVVERVTSVVDGIDTTIREVRSAIFELTPPVAAVSSVRAELLGVAREATAALGFEPTVRFEGPVDAAVPDDVLPHLMAVLREALSNVARHAEASRVRVEISADDHVTLIVTDNGKGLGASDRRSGLANMRQRAEQLGGRFCAENIESGGTELEWRVPLG
jgi:signal transduction histidine kinase